LAQTVNHSTKYEQSLKFIQQCVFEMS